MREWLEAWKAVATIIAEVAGGTVWGATGISRVRTELQSEIHSLEVRMEGRLSAVEAKLDLLIAALELKAGDDQ